MTNISDSVKVSLMLTTLVVMDLIIIAGIFIHGKANFVTVYKNLNQ